MYFAYFQSYVPQKSLMMDNYWIIMEFYGNKISKCPSLMEKSAPILGHRLLPSLSNKQLIINTFLRSPCSVREFDILESYLGKLNLCRERLYGQIRNHLVVFAFNFNHLCTFQNMVAFQQEIEWLSWDLTTYYFCQFFIDLRWCR